MSFKEISYLELWWPSCLTKKNHLGDFGRVLYEEYFCKIILNFDQWFSALLKYFLSRALAVVLFSRAEPFGQEGIIFV